MLVLLVVVVAVGAATDLSQRATRSGRLTDLREYYLSLQSGVSSCAGGLRDSLAAVGAILAGSATDRGSAESVALAGADACAPVSNTTLVDVATTPPPRSLNGYGLATVNGALFAWAYPAAALAQSEIYRLLEQHAGPGSAAARQLYHQLTALNATAQTVLTRLQSAATRLHGSLPPMTPPLVMPIPASLRAGA